MPSLEIRTGDTPPRTAQILNGEATIGRRTDCNIVLENETVSRLHARVFERDGIHHVEDLGSQRGTLLNDHPIARTAILRDGYWIRIADTVLVFRAAPAFAEDTQSTVLSALDGRADAGGDADPAEKLRAVLDLIRNLGVTLDLDELFPKILESAFRIFPQADRGSIWLRQGPEQALVPRASYKRDGSECATAPLSRSIADRVIHNGEAVLSSDAKSDERFDSSKSVLSLGIRSVMCAPLLASGSEAQGMLQLDTSSIMQAFAKEELEVLVNVANLAAQVVEHAQLHAARVEYERRERDLSLARSVQEHFLPQDTPSVAGFEIAHHYEAAERVGGDYFDYVPLPDGRLALVLGDVAGKGVSAALLMARLCSDARALLLSSPDALTAVAGLNQRVCAHAVFGRFVTLAACILDPRSGKVSVVNAGHMPPLCRRADGGVEAVGADTGGPPLGISEDAVYEETQVRLEPGDALLFFTDGVSEARAPNGDMLGETPIEDTLAATRGAGAIVAALLERVGRHTAGAPAADDLCAIALSRNPRTDPGATLPS